MSGVGPTPLETLRAEIVRAKPFIDAGPRRANSWLPSELIAMACAVVAVGLLMWTITEASHD